MEGIPTIGPDELRSFSWMPEFAGAVPGVQFSKETLETHAATHILIFTPQIPEITLNWLRKKFGVDPKHEPCMYDQDWYVQEDFAKEEMLDGAWHLIRKEVREDTRARSPETIESVLGHERFPTAVTVTFAFFAWWYKTGGEALWKHDFLWCSDRDHNGDRIYVGRYEDPDGINKKGFNIHRHLALRQAYSAAPEVIS